MRIKSRRELNILKNHGQRFKSRNITLSVAKNGMTDQPKFAVHLAGGFNKAVERNRVKRVIREYIRLNRDNFPSGHLVMFRASSGAENISNAQLRDELDRLTNLYKSKCS